MAKEETRHHDTPDQVGAPGQGRDQERVQSVTEFTGDGATGKNVAYGNMAGNAGAKFGSANPHDHK